jgi:general secretion pathway protein M
VIAKLRDWWQARAPRERVALWVAAALLGAALYLWLVVSADRARTQLRPRVTALRAQAAGLDRDALEIERLRASPKPAASRSDLRALLQEQANAAGLGSALTQVDVQDADHAQAAFGAVPFASWLAWVRALQAQHVRLDTVRIEALSRPGLVSASATFARASRR